MNTLTIDQMRETVSPEQVQALPSSDSSSNWRDRLPGLPGLPQVLRFAGATILVAALSVFLFQRWGAGNDLFRYLTLLGLSAGLTGAGLLSGILLREGKGARVFLGIVLLTLPIHFTVLGALLYSQFSLEPLLSSYPGVVSWQATDPTSLLLTLAGALAVLLPACWIAVRTFVRPQAAAFTVALFGLAMPLLLPTRSLTAVTVMALLMAAVVVWLELRVWRRSVALKTGEGRFLRGLLVLPFLLILGRGMWLYDTSVMLVAVAAVAMFGMLLVAVKKNQQRPQLASALAGLSLLPAATASWALADSLNSLGLLSQEYTAMVLAAPFVAALLLLSKVSPGGGSRYRLTAALVTLAVVLAGLSLYGGALHSLLALLVGVLTLSYGYLVEQKLVLVGGVLTAVLGLGFQVAYAVQGFELGGWLTLAVLGTLAILSASLLERFGGQMMERWQLARERLSGWEY